MISSLLRGRPGSTSAVPLLFAVLHGSACVDVTECPEIAGVDPLLDPGTVVLVGEIHGTREAPAFAARLTCHALEAGRNAVLALEIPKSETGRLARYLASPGGQDDRRTLLGGPFWNQPRPYGVSSRAMVDLIDRGRELRRKTGRLEVRPFDRPGGGGSQARDRRMAQALQEIASDHPEAVIVVLTGNVHARVRRRDEQFEPMGYLVRNALPNRRIVALDLEHSGGEAWVCTTGGCGVRAMAGSGSRVAAPVVRLRDGSDTRYDGVYSVGSLTASPPAVQFVP